MLVQREVVALRQGGSACPPKQSLLRLNRILRDALRGKEESSGWTIPATMLACSPIGISSPLVAARSRPTAFSAGSIGEFAPLVGSTPCRKLLLAGSCGGTGSFPSICSHSDTVPKSVADSTKNSCQGAGCPLFPRTRATISLSCSPRRADICDSCIGGRRSHRETWSTSQTKTSPEHP